MTDHDAGGSTAHGARPADLADADLVLRTRSGDPAAFGELWRRHHRSGLTVARSFTSSIDPDDLVQEAYTRVYQAIIAGGGPTGSFRAYLFTSIRNTASGWARSSRETAIDELDALEDPATSEQATADALDRGLTHRAFRSLPTRWQEVLWYSEIEQMKPAEIAPLLGMKPSAVAQLTFRAREGLRQAWIQAHLSTVAEGSACQWTIEHLGAYARNNLGQRDTGKVESHLADCARCTIVAAEAKEVSNRLALVLLPLTIGVAGAAGYLASLQGGVPVLALAAMPSSVMPGAVTVLPEASAIVSAAGTGGAAASGSAAAGGAAAGGAATTAGGMLTSVGATVGLAVAGAVLVGAVVAATIVLPTLNSPADNVGELSARSDAAADTTRSDGAAPAPGPSDLPAEILESDADSDAQSDADADPESPADAPVEDPPTTGAPAPVPPGGTPSTPVPPATPAPTPAPTPPPAPAPTLPDGSPTIVGVEVGTGAGGGVTLQLRVSGVPGATIAASIAGVLATSATVDPSGSASISLAPSLGTIALNPSINLRYVAGEESGPPAAWSLWDLLAW